MTQSKPTVAGSVRDVAFLDTETCFWQLARQQFQQLKAYSASGFPHIGAFQGPRVWGLGFGVASCMCCMPALLQVASGSFCMGLACMGLACVGLAFLDAEPASGSWPRSSSSSSRPTMPPGSPTSVRFRVPGFGFGVWGCLLHVLHACSVAGCLWIFLHGADLLLAAGPAAVLAAQGLQCLPVYPHWCVLTPRNEG